MSWRRKLSLYEIGKSGLTRLLAPAVLGALLIWILVEVTNFGGVRESLAANAEAAMIRWSLGFSERSSDGASPNIVTISVTDSDLQIIKPADSRLLRDADISEYASVLEKVAAHNPRWVVLNWLTFAHPLNPEYLKPLTSVIDRLRLHDRVTIAVNLNATETISTDFSRTYNIVEARDCYYTVNVYCTVSQDWTWMPQQVISRFMRTDHPWVVSLNLPHILPNILLNIRSQDPLTTYSFLDFRPPVIANIPDGSAVFIGNNATQDFVFRDNKEVIQRTYVADSRKDGSLLRDGIAFHEFWARLARMLEQGHLLAVMPMRAEWLVIGLLIVCCGAGILTIREKVLWVLVGLALAFPAFEFLMVRYARVYVPVVPLATALTILFLSGTYFTLAYSNFSKWRLQALSAVAASTADIKENFIHLISHNLNTPIAQLSGILDLLKSNHSEHAGLSAAAGRLEFVRVVVRAVLNSTTMASQKLLPESTHFRSVIENFKEREGSFLNRLGIELIMTPDEADEDAGEIWFYRFDLDQEFTLKAMLYGMTMMALSGGLSALRAHFKPFVDEPAEPGGLSVTITKVMNGRSQGADAVRFPDFAMRKFLDMAATRGVLSFEIGNESIVLRFPTLAADAMSRQKVMF